MMSRFELNKLKFNYMKEKITDKLKAILGEDAFDSDMQVSKNVSKLAKTVNYLTTQLIISAKNADDDNKEYIESVIKIAEEMLS